MKKLHVLVAAMMAIIFISCNGIVSWDGNISQDNEPSTRGVQMNDWKSQIEQIMYNPPELLINSGISLLSYEIIEDFIGSDKKLASYKKLIIEDQHMLPCYTSLSFDKIRVINKEQAINIVSDYQEYNLNGIEKYIGEEVSKSNKILRLRWSHDGEVSETICAVDDEQGIVYDNFITNTLIIQPEQISIPNFDNAGIPRIKRASNEADYTGGMEWSLTHPCSWLFGIERGHCTITHTGYYIGGDFHYSDCSAEHYMSIGNSDAKVSKIEKNSVSYAYGMATPGVSINCTISGGIWTVNFGTMIGSTLGGNGTHTHPLRLY